MMHEWHDGDKPPVNKATTKERHIQELKKKIRELQEEIAALRMEEAYSII